MLPATTIVIEIGLIFGLGGMVVAWAIAPLIGAGSGWLPRTVHMR